VRVGWGAEGGRGVLRERGGREERGKGRERDGKGAHHSSSRASYSTSTCTFQLLQFFYT